MYIQRCMLKHFRNSKKKKIEKVNCFVSMMICNLLKQDLSL